MHHLLIGRMTYLGHQDGFSMVKALVNYDARLSNVMIQQAIILYGLSTLKRYLAYAEINRRL